MVYVTMEMEIVWNLTYKCSEIVWTIDRPLANSQHNRARNQIRPASIMVFHKLSCESSIPFVVESHLSVQQCDLLICLINTILRNCQFNYLFIFVILVISEYYIMAFQ